MSFFGNVGCIVVRIKNRLEVRLYGSQLPVTARVSVPRQRSIVCARDPNGELFREMDLDSAASAVANCADRSAWRARRARPQAGSGVRGEANRMQALTLANFGMQCDPRPALVQVHPDGWSTSFRGR